MNAKEKAIDYFMQQEIGLCSDEDKPEYPLQLNDTLDIAIQETKKEVFDDFENELRDRRHSEELKECADIYEKLKERHLTHFNIHKIQSGRKIDYGSRTDQIANQRSMNKNRY